MLLNINLREDIQKYFPNFEYFNCIESDRFRLDFNLKDNLVGMSQEAFIYFWLLKSMKENPDGFCGLDVGCGQNIHFSCLGVNDYAGPCHPIYFGSYFPHITSQAENIDKIFNHDTFSCIIASHIIEHVNDPIIIFRRWAKLLRRNGLIIVLCPDARYEYKKWDPTHINFFSPNDFERLIINTNKDLLKTECFNDMHNEFSISFCGRRI